MQIPVPFRLDFSNLAVDDTVSFCVAILLAVIVNAEGQAWVATMLGDTRHDSKDRFHFNAFLHLDILGTICFFLGGFGWAKAVDIRADKFSKPVVFMILSRLAGGWANFMMAAIAASIVGVIDKWGVQDRVFTIVLIVNLSTAVFHLLPIPPLAGAAFVTAWFPKYEEKFGKNSRLIGAFLLIAAFGAERITGMKFISRFADPVVEKVFRLILG